MHHFDRKEGHGQLKQAELEPMKTNDPYLELVAEHWRRVVELYLQFQSNSPVMQALLKRQYEEAASQDKIVVFVRDNEKRKLVSYCLA